MPAPRDHRLVINLKCGRTRGASFAGDPRAVLIGLGMVLLCLLCAVYLAVQTKHQLTDSAGKLIMRTFEADAQKGIDHAEE
jgi:hypothetical protein